MNGQFINMEYIQAMTFECCFDGQQREVGIMLMVNRIKFEIVYEGQEMREFDRSNTGGFQNGFNSGNEIIEIRDMGHDIVSYEQVRMPFVVDQL